MTRKRVFIYVQHLLGIGHLRRAATLGIAAAASGLDVTLASGGFAVRGMDFGDVRFVQLPPLGAADTTFKSLVDDRGIAIDDEWKSRRRDALLAAWRNCDPHALVLELYPFGRRQMRFELLALLDAAAGSSHRPVIVSSVRDVLGGGRKDPSRQDEMLDVFEKYFDRLMVHGDPSLIPFGRTFRHANRIAGKLHYTGYVVEPAAASLASSPGNRSAGAGEVLVSAGGGAVGNTLLETAIRARRLTVLADRTWRVLAGVNVVQVELDGLSALAAATGEGKVVVERARPDFAHMLGNCELSVSQGGYNTMMELLQARARAVVVPFAGGAETEQTMRTQLLADRGLVAMVEESSLAPDTLARAVDKVISRPRNSGEGIDLDGATRSAQLLTKWVSGLRW